MQFTADLLGLDVEVAARAEGSPLGAAMAGAIGMGLHRSAHDLAALSRGGTTYRPAISAARADAYRAG